MNSFLKSSSLKNDPRVSFCLLLIFTCHSFWAFQLFGNNSFFQARSKENCKLKATDSGQCWPELPALLKEIWRLQARNTSERIPCFLPKWDCTSQRVEPLSHCFYGMHKPNSHSTINHLQGFLCYCRHSGDTHYSPPHNWLNFCPSPSIRNLLQNREGTQLAHLALSSPDFPSSPVLGPVLQGYTDYSTCGS